VSHDAGVEIFRGQSAANIPTPLGIAAWQVRGQT
jgi:hypothetical protein